MPRFNLPLRRCNVTGCNQQAAIGEDVCGTHRRQRDEVLERQADKEMMCSRIVEAESLDELKQALLEMVEKLYP